MAVPETNEHHPCIQQINLPYDHERSEESLKNLVYTIQPKWREHPGQLEIVKFTDGITNTLLKIARQTPGASKTQIDEESILMRAYGNNTDLLIDRDREAISHALLAERGMAPPLLARFKNGLLYKYIPGRVTTPDLLMQEPVWRGVARKLGEWHARAPIGVSTSTSSAQNHGLNGHVNEAQTDKTQLINGTSNIRERPRVLESRDPNPNLWSTLQKWLDALSTNTEKEKARKELLQQECERCLRELDSKDGIGEQGLIFGHCDLLSANVIILPPSPDATTSPTCLPVTFIDYEYATACPAAFDIANHFAEWAGYDLDYERIPTRHTRRAFISEYIASYNQFARVKVHEPTAVDQLLNEIDAFRGMPGLFWGIWALIQARISQIDFDYAQYAEDRLSEYWAWRAVRDNTPTPEGKAIPSRETRWNQAR